MLRSIGYLRGENTIQLPYILNWIHVIESLLKNEVGKMNIFVHLPTIQKFQFVATLATPLIWLLAAAKTTAYQI